MMMILMKPLALSDSNRGFFFALAAPSSKTTSANKRRAAGCAEKASPPNLAFIGGSFYYRRASLPSTVSPSPISSGKASALPVGDIAKLIMSSTSSPSSSSSRKSYDNTGNKSGSKRTQQQQEQATTYSNSRNRGANSANHNRRGHSFRLSNKEATLDGAGAGAGTGIRKRPINTKRPPRWEREGDKLYAEVTKELDALYDNGVADDDGDDGSGDTNNSSNHVLLSLLANKKKIASAQDVCRLLGPWTTATAPETNDDRKAEAITTATTVADNDGKFSPPNFLWGSLPVGPVLASRLYASGRMSPTPVQCAAFPILTAAVPSGSPSSINNGISRSNRGGNANSKFYRSVPKTKTKTKRSNGIIASPTGTGKTLAYLLPLLCTSPGGQLGEGIGGILIVTPTIELACQIQREVDVLWPPLQEKKQKGFDGSGRQLSSLFVVGDVNDDDSGADIYEDADDLSDTSLSEVDRETTNEGNDSYKVGISPGRMILRSIEQNAPTIIAGTPKMLRMLYREAGRIVALRGVKYSNVDGDDDAPVTEGECATSMALVTNLRAIVLDEADRLLRTEAVARETTERKNRKMEQRRAEAAAEEQAAAASASLDGVPRPLIANKKKPRLVIARQTQTEFLLRDLPIESLDDVQLICASATVGRTMRRQLMQILDKNSADAAATLVTGNDDPRVTSKNVDRRKSVLLPEKLRHAYRVVELDDDDINNAEVENDEESPSSQKEEELLDYINIIMPSSPSTTMAVRNEDIRVKHTMDALWNTMMMSETEAKPIIIFPGRIGVERVQQELMSRGANDLRTLRSLDGKRRASKYSTENDDSPAAKEHDNNINKWTTIPIYIIGERFARGLDLPDVEYVFMLSPPSSAAGYAHMAGRTGRSGRSGMAITLVRPKNNEVQRLAAIAEALGLMFTASMSVSVGGGQGQDSSGTFRVDGPHVDNDNDKL